MKTKRKEITAIICFLLVYIASGLLLANDVTGFTKGILFALFYASYGLLLFSVFTVAPIKHLKK